MKFLLLLAFYCSLYSSVLAQDIKKYVTENIKPISNIDTSFNEYSDLESIGAAIGDARIVMLGEQDHGDAPTFIAKTRLIKYLHEKKGFNVLAFESDFYGLTKGWDEVAKQPDSIRRFLKQNIFSLWTSSDACKYLFESYIPNSFQTTHPLYITGFDSQMYLDYSYIRLRNDLNEYLTTHNLTTKFSDENYKTFLDAVEGASAYGHKPKAFDKEKSNALKEGLKLIKEAQLENKDSSYWNIILNNLLSFANHSNENRDKSMSDNLKFLVDKKYKGEKIIVWAANAHVIKYTDQIKIKPKYHKVLQYTVFENMGTLFTKDPVLAATTYILGFTSYTGTAGRLWTTPFRVEEPNKDGFENWIPKETAYAFVDFKQYNKKFGNPETPFLMKAPSHFTIPGNVAKIPWNLVYDGVFFIRDMYPVQLVK